MILSAFVLWIIPVILSLITMYLVYRIYTFNRLNKYWLFIALGFFFIIILRVLTLLYGEGFFPSFFKLWYIYDPVLRIINSTCFIIGFWPMLKSFQNFEVLEKKVKKIALKKRRK